MLAIPLTLAGTGIVYLLNRMASGKVVRTGVKPSPLPEPKPKPKPPITEPVKPPPPPPEPDEPDIPAPGPNEGPVTPPPPAPEPPPDDAEGEEDIPTPPAPEPVTPPPGPVTPPAPAPEPEDEPDGPLPPAPTEDDVMPDTPPPPAPEPPPDEPEGEEDIPTPPAPTPVTPPPAPVTPPKPSGPPAGFSVPELARLSALVADDVQKRGRNYDRARMTQWQRAAGIDADGIYGGQSWGALEHAMGGAVAKSLFVPTPKQAYLWAHLVPFGIGKQKPAPVTPPAPAPTPVTPAPSPSSPPTGFNPARAAQLAPGVASDLAAHEFDYARAKLREFQQAAGIDVDGIYGGESWGALEHYMGGPVTKALFKPVQKEAYAWASRVPFGIAKGSATSPSAPVAPTPAPTPPAPPVDDDDDEDDGPKPPPGYDRAKAKKMAPQVAANLQSKGRANYDRNLLKAFQLAAGLDADGIYGGGSRGALQYFGARPPAAFFKPVEAQPYKWAGYDG